jgi:hypothetical protein
LKASTFPFLTGSSYQLLVVGRSRYETDMYL